MTYEAETSQVKMKRIFFTLLLSLLSLASFAQSSDGERIAAKVAESGAGIVSISCDFVQTKRSAMLENELVSRGKMWFTKPDKLRWEYTSPYSNLFIMNGEKALLKNEKGSSLTDVKKNRMVKGISSMVMGCISGEWLRDSRAFGVEAVERDGEWVAVLTPRRGELKQMWTSLELRFDPSSGTAKGIRMNGASGDCTVIEFRNVEMNRPVPSDVFSLYK